MNAPSASSTGSSLALHNLNKRYGATQAVSNVDLDIQAGEFITLLGPSGSGKSTILKMVAGFENPTEGDISIAGKSVKNMVPAKRNLGMVFQNYALFPHMTVAENVGYGLKFRKMTRSARNAKVVEMLDLVQLTSLRERLPRELSGGQQQRVALARALAIEPNLLLMDEPLGALDRSLRLEMSAQIKRLHRQTGTTFLYVTHDQEEALLLSDRVAIMKDSELVSCSSAEDLYNNPPDEFTATFFGNCNSLSQSILETGSSERIYFHQESVLIDTESVSDCTLKLRGTVREILFMGASYQVLVATDDDVVSVRVSPPDAQKLPQVGTEIFFGIHKGDVLSF